MVEKGLTLRVVIWALKSGPLPSLKVSEVWAFGLCRV